MQLMTEQPEPRGNIIVVDDTPANLVFLEDILRMQQYQVRSLPLGRLALAAAERELPDLILLDVNMPEMNGYEVCEQLKSNPRLAEIPVIFISALNETEDKVKGFRAGGADYISKPFQIEEVQARIETHLSLRRARQSERDLLERTLGGAVATLLELVQITSPTLVFRSHSIRDIVLWISKKMEVTDAWQHELAATLSLVGCIAMPNELFEKAYGGQELSPEENEIFRAHPEFGARLLSNIPRLETVASIIRLQQNPDADPTVSEQSRQGAQILHLALAMDQRLYRDIEYPSALTRLRQSGKFHGEMLDALKDYEPTLAEMEVRQINVKDICPGMILDEDLSTSSTNLLVFKTGMVFTRLWIERLKNFARTQGVQERVRVKVPTLATIRRVS